MISDAPVLQLTSEPAESGTAPGRSRLSRYGRPLLGFALPLLLAISWELVVWLGWSNGRLVPPPSRVFATIMELARSGELTHHIFATLWRVGLGFAVGVFFPVYLGVMGAILAGDRKIVEVGRVFRLSGVAMIRRILLPAVLPAYVVSLRVGLGLGWMFVVAAELIGASEGLGYLLLDGQQLGKPAQILAAIVIFAILGKLTDWLIEVAAAPFLRWQDAFVRVRGV